MTISLYSPMPPARTGVADYSASLVRALRGVADVEVNPATPHGVPLYHIGNNPLHASIYKRAVEHPGVVVLHDAVLHHFFLGTLDQEAYVAEFVYNYGEWSRDLALRLWQARPRSAQDERYFEYAMLRRLAERSRAVIVHNPAAADAVRRAGDCAVVVEIPHLWEPPPAIERWEVERLRQLLAVPAGGMLFGVFGHLRESKRLGPALAAFARVRERYPFARLLVAGEFVSRDLERSLTPMLRADGVIRAPYLSERDFWLHAAAVDVCINLRYPAAGETSGIAVRLMGLAKTVLLSAGRATERFPETACVRIDTGVAEREMLEAYSMWLCETPRVCSSIGGAAAAYIHRDHSATVVARRYVEVVQLTGEPAARTL